MMKDQIKDKITSVLYSMDKKTQQQYKTSMFFAFVGAAYRKDR